MSVDLETMRARLRLDANGFSAGIDGAQKQLTGFRGLLASAGSTAAGFLAANVIQRGIDGFTNQIGGIITAGSDLNETVSKTQVVFGDSFGAISKWAKRSAKDFGLSNQEAYDTVSTYGAMAKAAGQGGDAAVKFGTDLVGAAADLGSFWNFDPSQVAEDIRSGLSGESEPLRKYNIYLNEAAVQAKALEMGLVDSNGKLSDENKILARKALIMEQLGPAAGDYARTQKGLANGTRTLNAYWKNFQAWLGGKIVPSLAKGVAWINKMIARFQRLREKGLSNTQALLKAIRIELYQVFGRGTLNGINAVAHAFVWGFNLARDAIGAVTAEVSKWTKVMGWAFSSGLKVSSLVYAFPKPLRQVARGFLLVADAVGDAYHAFQNGGFSGLLDQLPATLRQIWNGLTDIGGAAINLAIDTAVTIGGWLWEHKDDIWGGIKVAVGWTTNAFKEAVTASVTAGVLLFGWLVDHKNSIWSGIKTAVGWGVEAFEEGVTATISTGVLLFGWLTDHKDHIWTGIKGLVGWGREKFTEAITASVTAGILLFGWFMDHKDNIWSGIKSLIGWGKEELSDTITVAVEATIELKEQQATSDSFVNTLGSALVGAITTSASFIKDIATAVWNSFTAYDWSDVVGNEANAAGVNFGSAVHDAIVSTVKTVFDGISDFSADDAMTVVKAIGAGIVAAFEAVAVAGEVLESIKAALTGFLSGAIEGLIFGEDVDFGSVVTKIADGIQTSVTADSMSEAAKAVAGALWDALKAIITGWSWQDIVSWIGGGGDAGTQPGNPADISGPEDIYFANPADKARFDASSGVARGQMTPPSVPTVPEGFTSNWHSALSKVGADIAEFAKRKQGFTDLKDEVDKTSTGSIASLRLMGDASRQVSSVIQGSARQIASAFSPLPGQLRMYGALAVNGFVAELLRGVAEAQAAATAIAAAVDQAIAKRLQIHSPSRVMANLGRHTVDPFLNELHRGATEADRFFSSMGAPGTGLGGRGSGGDTYIILEGNNIIGDNAEQWIRGLVDSGVAKVIDRRISSRRLGES